MKFKVRNGVFETNSSTVHAICINKKKEKEKPVSIELDAKADCFGKNNTFTEKANYIFKMCLIADREEGLPYFEQEKSKVFKFTNYLNKKGITVTYKRYEYYYDIYLGDSNNALQILLEDEELMDRFLFDDASYFHIMDNNYVDENLPLKEDYDIYTFDE